VRGYGVGNHYVVCLCGLWCRYACLVQVDVVCVLGKWKWRVTGPFTDTFTGTSDDPGD
jgi:hypothetical protein